MTDAKFEQALADHMEEWWIKRRKVDPEQNTSVIEICKEAGRWARKQTLEGDVVRGLAEALRNINGNIPGSTETLKTETPVLWECMQDGESALAAYERAVKGGG